eukprot:m.941625 g.941625  ORF g.941625 m.941625 type:complete len:272 (-) comp23834_c2_seq13:1780-2595(-)
MFVHVLVGGWYSKGNNPKATHVTKAAYKNTDETGISFPADAEVEVVEADMTGTGWTYIKYNGAEGWAPTDYLNPKPKTSTAGGGGDKPPTPVRPGVSGGAPAKPNPPAVPKPPAMASKPAVGGAKPPPVPPVPGGRKPAVAGNGGGRNKVAAPSGLGAIIGGGAPLKPVAPKAGTKPAVVPVKPKPPVAVAKPVKPTVPTKSAKPAVPTLPKKNTGDDAASEGAVVLSHPHPHTHTHPHVHTRAHTRVCAPTIHTHKHAHAHATHEPTCPM